MLHLKQLNNHQLEIKGINVSRFSVTVRCEERRKTAWTIYKARSNYFLLKVDYSITLIVTLTFNVQTLQK